MHRNQRIINDLQGRVFEVALKLRTHAGLKIEKICIGWVLLLCGSSILVLAIDWERIPGQPELTDLGREDRPSKCRHGRESETCSGLTFSAFITAPALVRIPRPIGAPSWPSTIGGVTG
jgi:hypothetical protein